MSKNLQVLEEFLRFFFTNTKIFLEFYVKKLFFINLRLGMFLTMFLFFGHFSFDVLLKYVLDKVIVYRKQIVLTPRLGHHDETMTHLYT